MIDFRMSINASACLRVGGDRAEEKALRLVGEPTSYMVPLVSFLALSWQGVH